MSLRNPWLRSRHSYEDCWQVLRSCSWLQVITKEITVDTTKYKYVFLLQHVLTLTGHHQAKINLCRRQGRYRSCYSELRYQFYMFTLFRYKYQLKSTEKLTLQVKECNWLLTEPPKTFFTYKVIFSIDLTSVCNAAWQNM